MAEPITLAEIKLHCRVDHNDDDALLTSQIVGVRQQLEVATNRTLVVATREHKLDAFPETGYLKVPAPPLIEVDSVTYFDPQGEEQTLDPAAYSVENDSSNTVNPSHGLIVLKPGRDWPSTLDRVNAITVTYSAGYATAPDVLKILMKLVVGYLYDTREAASEKPLTEVPGVQSFLSALWVPEYR